MEIRTANSNDIQGASAVQHAVIADDHPYEYARNIQCLGTVNLVAIHNGVVAGFISILLAGLKPDGHHLWERLRPYLAFLGVLPEMQRQDIGTELIRHALEIVSQHSASGLWLECPESSAKFYEKVGFVRLTPEAVQRHTGLTPKGPVYRLTSESATGHAADSSSTRAL
jgi:GNAT superfamily N-acetyltransferase